MMHSSVVGAVAWLALAALPFSACAQSDSARTSSASDVAARIRQVEAGLLPVNTIAGRPLPTMSLEERMRLFHVPGVSVAVVNDGKIEWAKGYGVAKAGSDRPVDSATLFQAASISKPVAALAALRLVEQGKLALDESVTERLTSWRVPESELARDSMVTLRRILSHNAGLTVHGFRGYARGESVPTVVQVLDGAGPANSAAVRVDVVPGSLHRYSGGGFTVAQLLMSDVTRRPFADLLEETVLRPIGMVHSTYVQPLPPALADRAAAAHEGDGSPIAGDWHTYPEQAAAGLWTTPSDLARVIIEVQRSAAGREGGVISPAMTREMLSRQAGSYGLGFALDGEGEARTFSHGGSNEGFRAMLVGFVETGQGAVIMANSELSGFVIMELLRGIARVYDWDQFETIEKTVVAIDSTALSSYVGRYRIDLGDEEEILTISLDGGRLQVHSTDWPMVRQLHAAAPNRFFTLESEGELTFEREGSAVATAIVLSGGGERVRAIRVQ